MNCTTCMIADFKSELCTTEFCKKCGKEGSSEDVERVLMNYADTEALGRVMEDNARFFNAKKPNKEIDRSWGIGMKVPACPNCEAIISPMCFWENCGDKVGWCEYCGQKIDWSRWEDE